MHAATNSTHQLSKALKNQLSKKLANPELRCLERTVAGSRDPVEATDTLAGPLLLRRQIAALF
jgi:hypothetical protein